jgi:dTDP-4-amino-4,6-dideoxygalactose transaminase
MKVPLLDLKAQYATIKAEIEAAIGQVMASQQFILGPKVAECETAIAHYSGCAHGIGISSGTDALLTCLMAESIGAGDEVITTPYSFFATAGSIARVGATPVFLDIEPATFNLDVFEIALKITHRTRAIIPVHLFGQMADMDPVMKLAREHNLVVIEDAAQAIGAEYKGRRAGSIGHYGCFSFFPSKNLGAAGDAGMVVTNDAERAQRVRILRDHGSEPKYYHKVVGGNFRLDAIQAAVVSAKLPHLDKWTEYRQRNARRYEKLFADAGLAGGGRPLVTLPEAKGGRHIFNQYVVRVPERNELRAYLASEGVGTEVYYPVPLHLQECFRYLGHAPNSFPESERAANETLALPIYPELTEAEQCYVVECIQEFFTAKLKGAGKSQQTHSIM